MIYLASLVAQTEDKIRGYCLIKTKMELDIVVADNTKANRVIIREDFSGEYFTPTGLSSYVENARRVNPNLIIEFESGKILTKNSFVEKVRNVLSFEELVEVAGRYPKEYFDTIRMLTVEDTERNKELLAASSNVSRLQETIDLQKKEIEDLRDALRLEQENKMQYASKFEVLVNRINYQYNLNVYKDKMFETDSNAYDKVIYIKEITRVQYVDTFVKYLKEILKILYQMPTRLVVIEPYYATGKCVQYPELVPHYKLKESDVVYSDVLMLGVQPKLMEDILKNPSNISILVVLDRAGAKSPHILGKNVEYFYTASDIRDVPQSIPKSRMITYTADTLFIPMIKDFDKLDSSERMSKYSSMSIIKRIVSLIEGR